MNTANTLKSQLLRYFRFKRGYAYVATECWKEDVVASNGQKLICVEVKMAWTDYQREYSKSKHTANSCPWSSYLTQSPRRNNPNHRYFAAPSELAHKIAEDLKARNSDYGCLSVDEVGHVCVLHKAIEVHARKVHDVSLLDMVRRLTSEHIAMREKVRP